MKVIFLNTWHGELREELRAYIARNVHDTEVFCFQEADEASRVGYEDLFSDMFTLCAVQRHEADDGYYGNAIFVRKDIEIVDKGIIFKVHPDEYAIGLALYVTLKRGEKELTVCNVHGIPVPGHKLDTPARLFQSDTILSTFKYKKNVIIGGDFNLMPQTQSVRMFVERGYKNLISDFAIATTRNRITFEKFPDNIQYFADYAFVSNSVAVESFHVPSEIVSDHQPLELRVLL